MPRTRIKKVISSEFSRILFLTLIAILGAYIFLRPAVLAVGGDSQFYIALLSDVLSQLRMGVFPVLIHQTQFFPMGLSLVTRAPYFFYFGALVDLLTGRVLSYSLISNIVFSFMIFSTVYGSYFLLRRMKSSFRWEAALLVAIYVLSPAVLGLPYVWEMYFSTMTLPFVPLLMYGIYRNLINQDFESSLIVGLSLTLLWMGHPPIAIVCSSVAFVAQLFIFLRYGRSIRSFFVFILSYCSFFLLSCWNLLTAVEVGSATSDYGEATSNTLSSVFRFVNPSFVNQAMDKVHVYFAASVRHASAYSVGEMPLGFPFLILLFGTWVLSWRRRSAAQGLFSWIFLCLTLFAFPIPLITKGLWASLPQIYELMNGTSVTYRLTSVLATAGLMSIYLARETLSVLGGRVFLAVLIVSTLWSISNFRLLIQRPLGQLEGGSLFTNRLDFPENVNPNSMTLSVPGLKGEAIETLFENRFLSLTGEPLEGTKEFLERKCILNPLPSIEIPFDPAKDSNEALKLRLNPHAHYVFGFGVEAENKNLVISFTEKNFFRLYSIEPSEALTGRRKVISLWHSRDEPEMVQLATHQSCQKPNKACKVTLKNLCFLEFNPNDSELPIQRLSLVPYQFKVNKLERPAYLETHRVFLKSYVVKVNGRVVPYSRSKMGRVQVLLDKGDSLVEMDVKSNFSMWVAFVLSGLSWLILFVLFVRRLVNLGFKKLG